MFCCRHVLKTVSALQIDKKKTYAEKLKRNSNASACFLLDMQMNYSPASLRLKQCFKLTGVRMHEGERSNSRACSS